MTVDLLTNYLLVAGLLFAIGMIGFMSRRNLIVMFISAEMMLQGVSLNLVAFNQYHRAQGLTVNYDGQIFTLFILTVAAAEAAVALALVVVLFRRSGTLDVSVWQSLREPGQPAIVDQKSQLVESVEPAPQWPTLPLAGVRPAAGDGRTDPDEPRSGRVGSAAQQEAPHA